MVCLVTLSLTINETLKRLSSLPILMQESFWWLLVEVLLYVHRNRRFIRDGTQDVHLDFH